MRRNGIADIPSRDTWMQINRGLHAIFLTISTEVAKELLKCAELHYFKCGKLPGYIYDGDYLAILNCGKRHGSYAHDLDYVIGIWITMIDRRYDEKHSFCRVSDCIAMLDKNAVLRRVEIRPDEFPKKDLWMSTLQTLKVAPRHFSKRLGGFLFHS
jgi:hypothetical protein